MKKFRLFVASLVIFPILAIGQTPEWQWADGAGGTNWDFGNDVATDASGNVYVTGYFASNSITFGSTVLNNAGSSPYEDVFFVKYNILGNVVWAKSAGGSLSENGQAVATDASGNVYVAGFFRSSSITFDSYTLSLSGDYNIFLVKYDASGNALWATSAATVNSNFGYDAVYGMTVDDSGNVFLAGTFMAASITFGSYTLSNTSVTGSSSDLFVVKYDSSGNAQWAKSAAGTDFDGAMGIAADASGNLFVSGYHHSSSLSFANDTLYNSGSSVYSDLFIAKFDNDGNELWAKNAGGDSYDYGRDVDVDASGNAYLTGEFYSGSVTFGAITVYNSLSSGYSDLYLTKYDTDGEAIWVRKATALYYDYSSGVATNPEGEVIITGYFDYTITFDNVSFTATNFSSDVFLAKYDTAGNFLLAAQATGNNADYSYKAATDHFGNTYVTGGFSSDTIHFGGDDVPNAFYNQVTNYYDIWVAKFGTNNCANIYYADTDGDGFGDPGNYLVDCDQPAGYVGDSSDCDDGNFYINPDAIELCNFVDDNCNGQIDEGVQLVFYADADGDTYGNADEVIFVCELPLGYVPDSTDCNDANPEVYPGAYDIPENGIDEDCDGEDAINSGVVGIQGSGGMVIYPNPTAGSFHIMIPGWNVTEAEWSIINSVGQVVFNDKLKFLHSDYVEVVEPASEIPDGFYTIQVRSESMMFTGGLVIQR